MKPVAMINQGTQATPIPGIKLPTKWSYAYYLNNRWELGIRQYTDLFRGTYIREISKPIGHNGRKQVSI